jgi:phosphohistidine phosphatase
MREVPDADSIEDRRIYNAEGETLFDVITDHGFDYERVMIIGHNPGLIVLMHLLMAEDGNRGSHSIVDFPSASFAEMVFEQDTFGQVNLDSGVLMRLLRPREMTTTGA